MGTIAIVMAINYDVRKKVLISHLKSLTNHFHAFIGDIIQHWNKKTVATTNQKEEKKNSIKLSKTLPKVKYPNESFVAILYGSEIFFFRKFKSFCIFNLFGFPSTVFFLFATR